MLEAIHNTARTGSARRLFEAAPVALITLLQQGYDLTVAEAALVPPFDPGEISPRWEEILGILLGKPADRTLHRRLRVTLLANGIPGPLDLADTWDAAGILEVTLRTIPRRKWVDELRDEDNASSRFAAMT